MKVDKNSCKYNEKILCHQKKKLIFSLIKQQGTFDHSIYSMAVVVNKCNERSIRKRQSNILPEAYLEK